MYFVIQKNIQTNEFFWIEPFHRPAYLSNIVLRNFSIWVSISTYVDSGTAKVPISAKIGVRVQ